MNTHLRPTEDEIEDYARRHVNSMWTDVGQEWRCPICKRSRIEVMIQKTHPAKNPYWTCQPIGIHHDHGSHNTGKERFDRMVVCGECNQADARAKRKLKLPANFSFSPDEIALFTTPSPHRSHVIDYSYAMSLFTRLGITFEDSVQTKRDTTIGERRKRNRKRNAAAGFVRMETRLPSRFVGVFRERCAQARQEFLAQQRNGGEST